MKALILKDIAMLRARLGIILLMILLIIGSFFVLDAYDIGFVNGYLVIIGATLCTSSISYDKSDNGMKYLMSMPINKKIYLNSKYVETLIIGLLNGVVATVFCLIWFNVVYGQINESLMTINIAATVAMTYVICAIGIPACLKHKPLKGSYFVILVILTIFLLISIMVNIFYRLGIDLMFVINTMDIKDASTFGGTFLVVSIILLLISYEISRKILGKMEF